MLLMLMFYIEYILIEHDTTRSTVLESLNAVQCTVSAMSLEIACLILEASP